MAENGREGLEIYKKQENLIDIVISDVIMENMTGVEMVRAIREINSKVAVLFITGQKINKSLKTEMDNLRAHVLAKPFEISELVQYLNKYFIAFKEKNND